MTITRAYRTELRPTPEQRVAMATFARAVRWTYNWGLRDRIRRYEPLRKAKRALATWLECYADQIAAHPERAIAVRAAIDARIARMEADQAEYRRLTGLSKRWSAEYTAQWSRRRGDVLPRIEARAMELLRVVPSVSHFDQCKLFTQVKMVPALAWLNEAPSTALQAALQNVDRAFTAFFRRVRAGEAPGFPRFKRRHGYHKAFKFLTSTEVERATIEGKAGPYYRDRIKLPKLGWVDIEELGGYLPEGKISIRSGSVTQHAKAWIVSITVDEEIPDPVVNDAPIGPGDTLGVHLGIAQLATLSTGEVIPNPRLMSGYRKRLDRLRREMSRRVVRSNQWEQTVAAIAELEKRIATIRNGAIHELTAKIIRENRPRRIVIEDWDIISLLRPQYRDVPLKHGKKIRGRDTKRVRAKGYAPAIADAAWGEINRQLAYKAAKAGVQVVITHPGYESSKRCSDCGATRKDFTLGIPIFECRACGACKPREINSALNLQRYVPPAPESDAGTSPGAAPIDGDPANGAPARKLRARKSTASLR